MADYRGYVTAAGQQFEALAKQMHYPVKIGFIEIGDGTLPDNESPISRTSLVHKTKQFPAIVEQDPDRPGEWIAKCHIPADDAINGQGYFIREMGCKLVDQGDGVLYAYRRISNDWKPLITEGEAKSFIYILRFIPSNGELIKPTINPSVVYVDKQEQERRFREHAAETDPHTQYAKENDVDTALKALEEKVKINARPVLHRDWVSCRAAIPVGEAPADGQIIENGRALYPDAWAAIQAGLVPVCSEAEWLVNPSKAGCYTTGDGKTNFRIPDYNGKRADSLGAVVFRGDGKNAAPVGEIQGDAIRNFTADGLIAPYDDSAASSIFASNGIMKTVKAGGSNMSAIPFNVANQKPSTLVRIDASLQVPVAPENRAVNVAGVWTIHLFGAVLNSGSVDAAAIATAIAGLSARVSTLESAVNARKSTCLVNAVGTGAPHETVVSQIPSTISNNTRYVVPNPFGNNTPVICTVELLFNGKWIDPGWAYVSSTAVYGVRAGYAQGEGIVIQSAKNYVIGAAVDLGGLGGGTNAATSAPCRVFVRKLEA